MEFKVLLDWLSNLNLITLSTLLFIDSYGGNRWIHGSPKDISAKQNASALCGIWTQATDFISYDNNYDTNPEYSNFNIGPC